MKKFAVFADLIADKTRLCNMAISFTEDNPTALRRLAEYLERESPFVEATV